ncbi:hypothetical protein IGI04_030937, partial [Brassica rapa subsp. trilocularis]
MKTVSPVATGSSESLSAQSPSSQVDMARKQPAEPSTPLVPPEEASVSASPVTQQIPASQNGESAILSVKAPPMADPETLAPKTPLIQSCRKKLLQGFPIASQSLKLLLIPLSEKALEKGSTSNTEVQITRPKKASHEQSDGSSHFTE